MSWRWRWFCAWGNSGGDAADRAVGINNPSPQRQLESAGHHFRGIRLLTMQYEQLRGILDKSANQFMLRKPPPPANAC